MAVVIGDTLTYEDRLPPRETQSKSVQVPEDTACVGSVGPWPCYDRDHFSENKSALKSAPFTGHVCHQTMADRYPCILRSA